MIIRNGAEDLLLDIGARAVWDIAEQMLGKGEVVFPGGLDAVRMYHRPVLHDPEDRRGHGSPHGPQARGLDRRGLGPDGNTFGCPRPVPTG